MKAKKVSLKRKPRVKTGSRTQKIQNAVPLMAEEGQSQPSQLYLHPSLSTSCQSNLDKGTQPPPLTRVICGSFLNTTAKWSSYNKTPNVFTMWPFREEVCQPWTKHYIGTGTLCENNKTPSV
jgi:hypothetical protein